MTNCVIGRWTFNHCTGMSVYIIRSCKLDDHENSVLVIVSFLLEKCIACLDNKRPPLLHFL